MRKFEVERNELGSNKNKGAGHAVLCLLRVLPTCLVLTEASHMRSYFDREDPAALLKARLVESSVRLRPGGIDTTLPQSNNNNRFERRTE